MDLPPDESRLWKLLNPDLGPLFWLILLGLAIVCAELAMGGLS